MKKLEVGQKLWFVYGDSRRGGASEVIVTKVGRKWATLSNNYRIDLQTWIADGAGYVSPGSCYASKEEYEEDVKLFVDWSNLRFAIERMRQRPEGVTTETIGKIRELLGIDGVKS